jgi:hypothetical protein
MRRIEVDFPVAVDCPGWFQKGLHELLSRLCDEYEAAHPDRAMWVFGWGSKPTFIPLSREEEQARGVEFDSDVLHAEISEREKSVKAKP